MELVARDAALAGSSASPTEMFGQAVAMLVGGTQFVALLCPAPTRSTLTPESESVVGARARVITAANIGTGTLTLKRVLSQVLDVAEPAELSQDEGARACERLLLHESGEAITILRMYDAEGLEPSALRSIALIASLSPMVGQTLRVLFVGDAEFKTVWAAGAPAGLAETLAVIQPAVASIPVALPDALVTAGPGSGPAAARLRVPAVRSPPVRAGGDRKRRIGSVAFAVAVAGVGVVWPFHALQPGEPPPGGRSSSTGTFAMAPTVAPLAPPDPTTDKPASDSVVADVRRIIFASVVPEAPPSVSKDFATSAATREVLADIAPHAQHVPDSAEFMALPIVTQAIADKAADVNAPLAGITPLASPPLKTADVIPTAPATAAAPRPASAKDEASDAHAAFANVVPEARPASGSNELLATKRAARETEATMTGSLPPAPPPPDADDFVAPTTAAMGVEVAGAALAGIAAPATPVPDLADFAAPPIDTQATAAKAVDLIPPLASIPTQPSPPLQNVDGIAPDAQPVPSSTEFVAQPIVAQALPDKAVDVDAALARILPQPTPPPDAAAHSPLAPARNAAPTATSEPPPDAAFANAVPEAQPPLGSEHFAATKPAPTSSAATDVAAVAGIAPLPSPPLETGNIVPAASAPARYAAPPADSVAGSDATFATVSPEPLPPPGGQDFAATTWPAGATEATRPGVLQQPLTPPDTPVRPPSPAAPGVAGLALPNEPAQDEPTQPVQSPQRAAPEPVAAASAVAVGSAAPAPAPVLAPVPALAPPAKPRLPPAVLATLMRRGNEMLAAGDISAARLFFERAAEAGSATAAVAAGRMSDPNVLARIGVMGLRADPQAARRWYRLAIELGDADASPLLERLETATR